MTLYLISCALLLVLSYTLRRGGHINVDLFVHILPPRVYDIVMAVALFAAVGVVAMMAYQVTALSWDSWRMNELTVGIYTWPLWLSKAIVAVSLIVLDLRLLHVGLTHLVAGLTGHPAIAVSVRPCRRSAGRGWRLMATFVGLGVLLVLLAVGVPVALSLLLSGALGLYLVGGTQLLVGILGTTPLQSIQNYEFVAIPMFILMANFIISSGVGDDMFDVAKTWMGRTPGGLAHATALTGAAFGAISGSSTAAAATLSATSLPGMLKQGYSPKLATGVVAISGTLAMLIPPSVAMVLYAILSGMSVGKLLIAGVFPGLLVTLTIMATVAFLVWRHPEHAPPAQSYTMLEKIASLRSAWTFIVLFLMVTGVIYSGVATPTEASAFGAFGAFVLVAWRRRSVKEIGRALVATAQASCMIAFIVLGALVFGYFLTLTQSTQHLIAFLVGSGLSRWAILLFAILLYLVLGCFMDLVAMLILTVPVIQPLMVQLGFDPIWFAVITIVMGELGMVTPPLGMNVFVISKYTGLPVADVFNGSVPHIVAHMVAVAILVLFPQIVLWLPYSMQ